jgi:valyl-tRNA synthetase
VRVIRNLRTELKISPGEKTDIYIETPFIEKVSKGLPIITSLAPVVKVLFSNPGILGASSFVSETKITVPILESKKEQELNRMKNELEKKQKLFQGNMLKINNQEFRAKAPAHIVESLVQLQAQIDEIELKIKLFKTS